MEDYLHLRKQVDSKESFLRFLRALSDDWHDSQEKERQSPSSPYGPNANGWENPELGRFLEAMADWGLTENGNTGELNVPEEPSWQTFARMLSAAKVYE